MIRLGLLVFFVGYGFGSSSMAYLRLVQVPQDLRTTVTAMMQVPQYMAAAICLLKVQELRLRLIPIWIAVLLFTAAIATRLLSRDRADIKREI